MHKSGFVTIVGRPNVGKSTLVNCLIGEKLAITSPKPQTTRTNLKGIITEKDYQIIFIDTPGIHQPKTKLGQYMVDTAQESIPGIDAIVIVCDSSDYVLNHADIKLIEMITQRNNAPVFLVLNKSDIADKGKLLEKIARYSELYAFKDIIPLSAKTGDGADILIKDIVDILPEGPLYFPDDISTDTTMKDIAREIIREKILFFTSDEVPHGTGVEIIVFNESVKSSRVTNIEANIYCEKPSHKGILIGKDGTMLKKIGTYARRDIENIYGGKINLKLWVKVKDDWRNDPFMLKDLGYK